MRYAITISLLVLFLSSGLTGQQKSPSSLRLIFAGDIMGHDSQIEAARTGTGYDYDTCFSVLRSYIESADIAIANLEVTLAGPPYKGYPQFSSPDELAPALKNAGFDLMITANNHSLDRGKKGLERTLIILENNDLLMTGTFTNEQERNIYYPLILEKNGIRIALLNYTYGTNGLKTEHPNIVNYIDREQIALDLNKAKLALPDFIIVTMHWGLEYQREENTEQQALAEFIAQNGADAIIGSHPHVVQPLRLISTGNKQVPVLFSLGNFISNQRNRYTDGGILFELTIEKDTYTRITDFGYLPVWVYKQPVKNEGNQFVLLPSNKEKQFYNSLGMSETDYEKLSQFNEDTRNHMENIHKLRSEIVGFP